MASRQSQTPTASSTSRLVPGSGILWNSVRTPASSSSSGNNTYTLPTSPMKNRRSSNDSYRPKISRTTGAKPACLVNASVTYCGNNQIYAFGGFDQYTDEVYNHVLKLDLNTLEWSLVDNYGDIPGVRMGHTASLWQGNKLLIHGGENEHREYLSDVVIFDIATATWTQPEIRGPVPRGRARHAAAVYDDKLFVMGGLTGQETTTLDDICCLDLKTWTWSRSWTFVGRFDHSAWVWGGRMWVYGGLGTDMERSGELWWLDLKSSPALKGSAPEYGNSETPHRSVVNSRSPHPQYQTPIIQTPIGPGGYSANTSSIQSRTAGLGHSIRPAAPGSVSSVKFVYGPNVPTQALGTHFHCYSSGAMLDFVTPASTIRQNDCNLSALELNGLQWQKLAEGNDIFDPSYRWHYCVTNGEGTKAWLLGCSSDVSLQGDVAPAEEYLSDVLSLDLKKYGLLGNDSLESRSGMGKLPASDRHPSSSLHGLGADLASMFDHEPTGGIGGDFIVTAESEGSDLDEGPSTPTSAAEWHSSEGVETTSSTTSRPIYVHKLILQARWGHFNRVYAAQMSEFHTKKMHIQEPYSVVRAFLYYLYTDSIAKHEKYCRSLDEVAGMLVMAQIYDMPRLRLLCIHRLSRELDVESAAVVWEKASIANEDWLKGRAASFCLTHWGRLVRTKGFKRLSRQSMVELCEVGDIEARVVGGDELEMVGGLGGSRIGGSTTARNVSKGRSTMSNLLASDDMEDVDGDEDEGMDVN